MMAAVSRRTSSSHSGGRGRSGGGGDGGGGGGFEGHAGRWHTCRQVPAESAPCLLSQPQRFACVLASIAVLCDGARYHSDPKSHSFLPYSQWLLYSKPCTLHCIQSLPCIYGSPTSPWAGSSLAPRRPTVRWRAARCKGVKGHLGMIPSAEPSRC